MSRNNNPGDGGAQQIQDDTLRQQSTERHLSASIDDDSINISIQQPKINQKQSKKCCRCVCVLFIIIVMIIAILLPMIGLTYQMLLQEYVPMYRKPTLQIKMVNKQHQKQPLGKYNSTLVNIQQLGYNQYDIYSYSYQIQGNTYTVSKSLFEQKNFTMNFHQMQKQFWNNIAYEEYVYHKPTSNKQKYITYANQSQLISYFNNMFDSYNKQEQNLRQDISLQLIKSNNLTNNQSSNQNGVRIQDLQYYYADTKYGIGNTSNKQQTPICIFTQAINTSKQQLQQYMVSLNRLNYTNFHLLYINQYSQKYIVDNQFSYLNQSNTSTNYKITLINNRQKLGSLANIYFWVAKYCAHDDIVLVLGQDQQIIGRQALKIINSYYQQQNIWYSTINYIQKDANQLKINKKTTIPIRTFRRKLINSIPFQSLIQYRYDKETRQTWPSFSLPTSNNYINFFQFQNINKYAKCNLNQFILLLPENKKTCLKQQTNYDLKQLKLKNPLKRVFKLGQKAEFNQMWAINKQNINNTRKAFKFLTNCQTLDKLSSGFQNNIKADTKNDTKTDNNKTSNKKFYKRTIYNQQYIGKQFGHSNQAIINLRDYYIVQTKDEWKSIRVGETKSKQNAIYVLTPTDLNKLIKKIDFWRYKDQLQSEIPYQVIQFQPDQRYNSPLPQLQYTSLQSDQQIEQFINNLPNIAGANIQNVNNNDFQILAQAFFNPTNQQVLEAQLYYFNKKYNINRLTRELPICIWTAQYNIFKKNQFKQYFDSLQRLNYSNYHIVYTDDNSNDGSVQKIYELVNSGSYNRIKNRMKIIHNLQSVGGLGNMYFWTQKFCNEDDIVVNIDADDAIIGTQTLKIISSVYEDSNIWYAYSRYLNFEPSNKYARRGFGSQYLFTTTDAYRRARTFITSHIRTFRLKLMKAVPIYQLLDFHYNTTTKIAWPTFQSLAFDTAQVHAHLELAGNNRIKFMPEYFYAYFGSAGTRNCYSLHQRFDQLKNSVKTPLQRLNSLQQKGRQIQEKSISEQLYIQPNQFNRQAIQKGCYLPSRLL